ncbi:hypothetical protein AAL_06702 [Moelleriella libera RCEF 2490]|uniref:Rhodopsin domain-containing protein n=1 Tax=Moelleriella libera RCEF 2490 TaxID=1081109 RepID=A0A167YKH5_9HYPO|nr:hypothetical protein AAL_06702 [Moelleriella libera RCEF 2490]
MAVVLVWHLAMPFKTKVMVVSAFSAQLLVILPIVYRLLYVRRAVDRSDVTMSITESVMATQVVMHFSIMAATFPCFRQFLQAFDSGLGATTKIGTETTAVAPSAGAGQSHALDSLESRASSGAGRERLRPDQVGLSTKVAASVSNSNSAGEENMSIESMGSDKAIWRTRRWEIHYESRARV